MPPDKPVPSNQLVPSDDDEYKIRDDDPDWKPAETKLPEVYFIGDVDLDADGGEEEKRKRGPRVRRPLDWAVISGGFGFPLSAGARWQWLQLSLLMPIALFAIALAAGGPETNPVVKMLAFGFGLPLLLLVGAVFAVKGLTILTVTAGGSRTIEDWPPIMALFDSLGEVLFVFIALLGSAGVGWIFYHLLAVLGDFSLVAIPIAVYILFPFLLLSSLEAGSPVTPFSKPIYASLRFHTKAWLAFFGQVTCLTIACFVVVGLLMLLRSEVVILPVSVVLAAAVMIYFRLLGRLGWHCLWVPEMDDDDDDDDGLASKRPAGDEDWIGRLE